MALGKARFAHATRLLIAEDAGGSNGYLVRTWKWHLAKLESEDSGHAIPGARISLAFASREGRAVHRRRQPLARSS